MSLRGLVEGDCGGVNPLMQLGGQFTRDVARKDEGFATVPFERHLRQDEQMVNEFLGHTVGPPQSFQMGALLQEMREIEELHKPLLHQQQNLNQQWANEFGMQQQAPQMPMPVQIHMQPQQQQLTHVREFFDEGASASPLLRAHYPPPMPYQAIMPAPYQQQQQTDRFFEEVEMQNQTESMENWLNDYEHTLEDQEKTATNYNEKFWQRLQDEWQKLSEDTDHPWLSEYNENYDPYKEYQFAEENPMQALENAFEKGKEYLAKGDIPSAVLCFEAAAKKEPENAEIWEFLGMSQAENEMDPQSIAALKRSLELKADNPRVLMALAVCYTNESLQSHAIKMLTNWLQMNPKYSQLLEQYPQLHPGGGAMASSLIHGSKLQELQQVFLDAVRLNPNQVDPEVQEALGVLFNLSSEFDKAVDCFQSALSVDPQNAKIWNRLGASLANGSRSVEAVEAYQRALQLEPGFIRVRYNVGVCCMNLKAYKQSVEHLLTALNMQANSAALRELPAAAVNHGQQQMSDSIWSTLKMVISLMGRSDLHHYVNERNLEVLTKEFSD